MFAIEKKAMMSGKRKKRKGAKERLKNNNNNNYNNKKPICEFLEIPSMDKNRHSICGKHEGQRSICQFASCAR
jgi:hypothetical protein